jgi:RNA polymerase sigma-70 factor (ECF subfamily)
VVPEHESVKIAAGWDDLARARGGSQEAWRVLFEQHSPPLLRMAALMTGSPDAARDCVQETFVRVLNSIVHHQSGSLRAYLSTIVYRLALNENMRQTRRTSLGATEPASPDPSPLDQALANERQREVARVLRTLPDHHRDILILRLHGDHSYEEISEITGLSIGTVKSRLFYAVKSARAKLKKRGMV